MMLLFSTMLRFEYCQSFTVLDSILAMNQPQQAREKDKSYSEEKKPKEIPNQGNSLLHDVSL